MANKHFVKQFSADFAGINAECSPLEFEGNEVNRAVNMEFGPSNSLRGRVGSQLFAMPGGFFGITEHSWSRTNPQYIEKYTASAISSTSVVADGSTVEELLAVTDVLWRGSIGNIKITNVSATPPIYWYSAYTAVDGHIHFYLQDSSGGGGAKVTLLDFDCGTGLSNVAISGGTTLYDLLVAIDALPKFSINTADRTACPPFAIINGNQTGAGAAILNGITQRTFTVFAGHSFKFGDKTSLYGSTGGYGVYPYLTGGLVYGTGATTIAIGPSGGQYVKTGIILGELAIPAASLFVTSVQSSTATAGNTFNLPYPRWEYIDCPGNGVTKVFTSHYYNATVSNGAAYKPPTFTSANGNLYFAMSQYPGVSIADFAGLFKYDGQSCYAAGLPQPTLTAVPRAGAGVASVFKYKAYLKRVDAQGNIIESQPSTPVTATILATSPGTDITTSGIWYAASPGSQYQANGGIVTTAATYNPGDWIPINNGGGDQPTLRVGDYVICATTNHGNQWNYVTDVDHITVAPAARIKLNNTIAYIFAIGSIISQGVSVVILRTTNGGNTYYQLTEIPNTFNPGGSAFFDAVTDATLITQARYLEVDIGKEHNPPPHCSLVCQHQGGLAVAGIPEQPNTVYFSSADGIEYMPIASNNFDVPSTVTGPVTAIASDTADRLAVFKARAYYDVQGDLDGGSFSINPANEGDYGVASQATIKRVKGTLIGLSNIGIVPISSGVIGDQSFRRINARLINQSYNNAWAVAVNDFQSRNYACTTYKDTATLTSLVLDYSREKILALERGYGDRGAPIGGYAITTNDFYTLYTGYSDVPDNVSGIVYRRLERFYGNSATGNDGDSYIDHCSAIPYILESQPINWGEPALLKTPARLRTWSIPNDSVINGWVPWSALVETGAGPLAATVGGTSPGATVSTISFAVGDIFKDVKLVPSKCHFYIVRYTTSIIRQAPFLTGFELMLAENYQKEDFVK